jgi:hypothetical protein
MDSRSASTCSRSSTTSSTSRSSASDGWRSSTIRSTCSSSPRPRRPARPAAAHRRRQRGQPPDPGDADGGVGHGHRGHGVAAAGHRLDLRGQGVRHRDPRQPDAGTSGTELARMLRATEQSRRMPLVLLTSALSPDDHSDRRLFDALLTKPVRLWTLMDTLASLIVGRPTPARRRPSPAWTRSSPSASRDGSSSSTTTS